MFDYARLVLGFWLCSSALAAAQIEISLSAERNVYLLYEPLIVTVEIKNVSGTDLIFTSPEGGDSWLDFLISKADKTKVREDRPLVVPTRRLADGETAKLPVNLTPYFLLRDSGQYTVSAVVRLPGRGTLQTDPLILNLGRGEVVWKKIRPVAGTERHYSVIRFLQGSRTTVYARVEEPAENLVYSTVYLGFLDPFTQVRAELEDAGRLHVLHPVSPRQFQHTVLNGDGMVLETQEYFSTDRSPTLLRNPDGGVVVVGGAPAVRRPVEREKLSAGQNMDAVVR